MTLRLQVVNPLNTPFHLWASLLTQDLAAYNVPNPPETEQAWRAWAARVYDVPEITQLGCPNPNTFPEWKPWALSFYQALG